MALPSNSRPINNAGFTLIEIMMVMAFVAIIGGFTLIVSLDSYREYNFHSDRDLLVSALQRARSQAEGNVCLGASCTDGLPHGVSIHPADHPTDYVIFQTIDANPDYAHRDATQDVLIETNPATVFTPGSAEFVFGSLSGNPTTPGTITLSAAGHSSTVTIGQEGQITWTN